MIVVDPRKTESARIADLWLPLKGGTNMALVNAFGHVLVHEGLYDRDYVSHYVEGFAEYAEGIKNIPRNTPRRLPASIPPTFAGRCGSTRGRIRRSFCTGWESASSRRRWTS